MSTGRVRVLVVDDQELVRAGFVALLWWRRRPSPCGDSGTPEPGTSPLRRPRPTAAPTGSRPRAHRPRALQAQVVLDLGDQDGGVTQSSAPAVKAIARSASSDLAVSMITGICASRSSSRSRAQTS